MRPVSTSSFLVLSDRTGRGRAAGLAFFAAVFVPWPQFQPVRPLRDDAKLLVRVAATAECEGGVELEAALAVSLDRRVRGLSRRKARLARNEAMLFVFEAPREVQIWMRDTWIPLGVAFFDERGAMTAAYDMPVEVDPRRAETRYASNGPAVTALEFSPEHYAKLRHGPRFLCVKAPSARGARPAKKSEPPAPKP